MTDPKAPEGEAPNPPSTKALLMLTAGSAAAAALIVFGAVLPAEFNRDPLGIGKATGLSRLWAPEEEAIAPAIGDQASARSYAAPLRTDVFEIHLAASGDPDRKHTLEFKVRMKKDADLVYSWSADGLGSPDDLIFDFHGHTEAKAGEKVTVAHYDEARGAVANGALTAPVEGIHGWYFRNRADGPVTIRLKLSGFYELIEAGQEGNLGGVAPKVTPAA